MGCTGRHAGRDRMSAAPPPAVSPPEIRAFQEGDRAAVIELWRVCNLTIPANDPSRDIDFCRLSGHDGHRGWIYYVATAPDHRGKGVARLLIRHAEAWLGAKGVPKLDNMTGNT